MISWAILGIAFATFLPGLVFTAFFLRNTRVASYDIFLISFPVSIVLNFLLVAGLVYFNLYETLTLRAICIVAIATFCVFLFWNSKHTSMHFDLKNTLCICKTNERNIGLFLLGLFPLLYLWATHQTSVFDHWDAVATWSRWAVNWYDQSPIASWGYPPTVPILYSIVDKMAGSTNLQIYAKQVAYIYPLFSMLCFWRAASISRHDRFLILITSLVFLFLFARANKDITFIFSGYADPFIAALAAYFFYLVILLKEEAKQDVSFLRCMVFMSVLGISLAAPALIKQNGIFLVFASMFYVVFFISGFTKHIRLSHLLIVFTITGCISSSWYIYSFFKYNDYYRAEEILNPNLFFRFYLAFEMTIKRMTLIVATVWIYAHYKNSFVRHLTCFFVAPLWLLWAYLVSYDFRTALYLLPFIAWQIAIGFDHAYRDISAYSISAKRNIFLSASGTKIVAGILLFLAIALIGLPHLVKDSKILDVNTAARLRSNDHGFNRYINALFSHSTLEQKTISCDQMLANLPESKDKFVPIGDCEKEYLTWLARNDVKYLIYWVTFAPRNPADVRKAAQDAKIQFIEQPLGDHYILFEKID